eukprot:6462757-Prymnesium_polylepis.1
MSRERRAGSYRQVYPYQTKGAAGAAAAGGAIFIQSRVQPRSRAATARAQAATVAPHDGGGGVGGGGAAGGGGAVRA